MLTQSVLRQRLHYSPRTGVFTWTGVGCGRRVKKGDIAGSVWSTGYRRISLSRRAYGEHRLAFLYMTGRFPTQVDHRNRNKKDNRWSNLREATASQNGANRRFSRNNTSGFKGVTFHKGTSKWQAGRRFGEKFVHLGLFETREEAAMAYQRAMQKTYGVFACGALRP